MTLHYKLVEAVISIEFVIIIGVLIATTISRIMDFLKEKRKNKLKKQIEKYLKFLIENSENFDVKKIPSRWKKLNILLFIVKEFDQNIDDTVWQIIRMQLIRYIILPLARKAALRRNWISKLYAAQSFELYAEKIDNELITKLVLDKTPIVRLTAARAAVKYGLKTAFESIIQNIGTQPRLTQALYLQVFNNAPPATRVYIEDILNKSATLPIRLTCYRILLNYPSGEISKDVLTDINSTNLNLKLAAIRLLAWSAQESSIPLLIEQLKDKHWETKVVVLHILGYARAEEAAQKIAECLHDENWWVRLSSAQALKNLGKRGEEALISEQVIIDEKAFEVVRHVLNTL